jgi:hypothetical protein
MEDTTMGQTNIDRTDPKTGRELAIPSDIASVIATANQWLEKQLKSMHAHSLHATWSRFENHPSTGWTVSLDVYTPEYSYGRELRVDDLRQPRQAKESIWSVLVEFAETYSDKIGEQLRQIREDLKQLLASGSG